MGGRNAGSRDADGGRVGGGAESRHAGDARVGSPRLSGNGDGAGCDRCRGDFGVFGGAGGDVGSSLRSDSPCGNGVGSERCVRCGDERRRGSVDGHADGRTQQEKADEDCGERTGGLPDAANLPGVLAVVWWWCVFVWIDVALMVVSITMAFV